MSSAPYGLAPSRAVPTGCTTIPHWSVLARSQLNSSSLPHGNMRPSVPRAAFSHSASVGNRLPPHSQNATAWSQVMLLSGKVGVPSGS